MLQSWGLFQMKDNPHTNKYLFWEHHLQDKSSASFWVRPFYGKEQSLEPMKILKGLFISAFIHRRSLFFFTSTAVRAAAHGGALDGVAGLVHTPAVSGGVPALHGLVLALLVTLRLVRADLADGVRWSLQLAFGLDHRCCWNIRASCEYVDDEMAH